MKLCLTKSEILDYASQYDADYDTDIEKLAPEVKERGFLTSPDLIILSRWKSDERNIHHAKSNSDDFVQEMTRSAFTAINERDRIDYLCCLQGVELPTASAILHWFHTDDYPIWDFRALETIQFDKSQYKNWFERWEAYVSFCQRKAKEYDVDMRTLDRALWQHSKKTES